MAYSFSKASFERLRTVHLPLQQIAVHALKISLIDFGVPEYGGRRTTEEQQVLYESGVSNADGVNNISKHQLGHALDVFAYVDGKASWDKDHLTLVAAAMLQAASEQRIMLRWGGFWRSFPDYPHFELIMPT